MNVHRLQRYLAGLQRYFAAGLFVTVFWLLFGEFAIALRDRAKVPAIVEFLRQFHASDTLVALLVTALPALLSCVVLPVVGFRSDRYRGRWGRRLPFLVATVPCAAFAMMALGYCAAAGAWTHRLLGSLSPGLDACALGWFCACWTLFETLALITLALYSGLVNDVVPPRYIGRFYAAFRIVSLSAGIIFNRWIFALTQDHLRAVFVGIGLFFGVACLLMCMQLRGRASLQAAAVPAASPCWSAMLAAYWHECLTDRWYVLVFLTLVVVELVFVPFNTFSQLYAESLGIGKATLGSLLATGYAVSIGLSYVIGWLVDRFDAARITAFCMGLYVVVAVTGFHAVHDSATFAFLYVFHVVVSGACYTAMASLPMALFPRGRFLQFDAVRRLFSATGNLMLSLCLGPLLDATGHRYVLTFLAGGLLGCAGLAMLGFVWWRARTSPGPGPARP